MKIVTDRASDLSPEQLEGLDISFVPMRLTLDGKTYSSGEDISSAEFYDLLEQSDGYPTTSQATAGDFAEIYRRLAKVDPEIFSIHVSSGMSGTLDSARAGAEMVPEAHVTFWDTKTLSCPEAWQVEAAAYAAKAGWTVQQICALLAKISQAAEGMFTIDTLKYLIHGGRISHLKGLMASLLNIKPIIAVTKDTGKYYTIAQERTYKRAIQKTAEMVTKFYAEGSTLRVQLLHGKNPEGVEILRERLVNLFQCVWSPTISVCPILGAHTGKGVVGLSFASVEAFADVPGFSIKG